MVEVVWESPEKKSDSLHSAEVFCRAVKKGWNKRNENPMVINNIEEKISMLWEINPKQFESFGGDFFKVTFCRNRVSIPFRDLKMEAEGFILNSCSLTRIDMNEKFLEKCLKESAHVLEPVQETENYSRFDFAKERVRSEN